MSDMRPSQDFSRSMAFVVVMRDTTPGRDGFLTDPCLSLPPLFTDGSEDFPQSLRSIALFFPDR